MKEVYEQDPDIVINIYDTEGLFSELINKRFTTIILFPVLVTTFIATFIVQPAMNFYIELVSNIIHSNYGKTVAYPDPISLFVMTLRTINSFSAVIVAILIGIFVYLKFTKT